MEKFQKLYHVYHKLLHLKYSQSALELRDMVVNIFPQKEVLVPQLQGILNELDQWPQLEDVDGFCFENLDKVELRKINLKTIVENALTYINQEWPNNSGDLDKLMIGYNLTKILRPTEVTYNYRTLKALDFLLPISQNLNAKNVQFALDKLDKKITALAELSGEFYSPLNLQENYDIEFRLYIKAAKHLYDIYGMKAKSLIVLDDHDSITGRSNSFRVWWKMKFINKYHQVDYLALQTEIQEQENMICTDFWYKYPDSPAKKKSIFFILYQTAGKIDEIRSTYNIESRLFDYFPVSKIREMAEKDKLENNLLEEIWSDYIRFCPAPQ